MNGFDKNTVGWTIQTSNIPADNIKSFDIPYGGSSITASTHTKSAYSPLKIKFRIDNRYANYLILKEWLDMIQDDQEGYYDANNLTDYQSLRGYATDISIASLDEFNNPIIIWRYTHCFPTDIDEINLDYTKSDDIDMTVTFKFSQKIMTHLGRSNK